MYKLLVLDMDGTLLDEHQQISSENVSAIQAAVEKGIHVVIATGRTKSGIDPYLKQLGLQSNEHYNIVCSGALVSTNTGRVISSSALTPEDFQTIYNIKEQLNIAINVYTDKEILIEDDNYYSKFDAIANNLPLVTVDFDALPPGMPLLKAMLINEDLTMVSDFNRIFPSMAVEQPTIKAKDGYNKRLFNNFSIFSDDMLKNYNISKVTPYNIEISKKQANKKVGVETLAELLDIKQEEIICIGDSGNDRQMIKYAGLGVAMGNAFPEIKEIADVITDTNINSGVAKIIHDYLL